MLVGVNNRVSLVASVLIVGVVLAACGSAKGASATSSPTTAPGVTTTSPSSPATTAPSSPVTTAAEAAGPPTCPTMAQADAALGVTDSGPKSTSTAGGGIVCEYTGGAGAAAVAIFAHQAASVFAGQVKNAPGAPAMPPISGVGDGAFGSTTAGRSIVNAYSNASRTVVAAQAPGALAPVEALARVALADN
jgi:hypothetical protein